MSSTSTSASSSCRHKYHADCELAVNRMINEYLRTSYVHLSFAHHFERDDLALCGAAEFFRELSNATKEEADLLLKYQTQRGGRIELKEVAKPDPTERTLIAALGYALDVHKRLSTLWLEVSEVVDSHGDAHLADFIEDHYVGSETERIKRIADKLTNLQRVGTGLGEYLFDKHSL